MNYEETCQEKNKNIGSENCIGCRSYIAMPIENEEICENDNGDGLCMFSNFGDDCPCGNCIVKAVCDHSCKEHLDFVNNIKWEDDYAGR